MKNIKTTASIAILLTILLFPAIPHAALEHYVVEMNFIDVAKVRTLSSDINLFSIYTGATLISACALGVFIFIFLAARSIVSQARERNYRAC